MVKLHFSRLLKTASLGMGAGILSISMAHANPAELKIVDTLDILDAMEKQQGIQLAQSAPVYSDSKSKTKTESQKRRDAARKAERERKEKERSRRKNSSGFGSY